MGSAAGTDTVMLPEFLPNNTHTICRVPQPFAVVWVATSAILRFDATSRQIACARPTTNGSVSS